MKNKDHSIPASDNQSGRIIETNFPQERPIFWGPNQETKYPDTYNEPSGWRENDILHIPRVARFIIGGKASQRRMFPIGYHNMAGVRWHFKDEHTIPGFQPRDYTYMSEFFSTDSLPVGSNLTAHECYTRFRTTSPLDKGVDFHTPTFSNQYAGYQSATVPGVFGPVDIAVILQNSGISPIGPPTLFVDPFTGSPPFSTEDTVKWCWSTPGYLGFNPTHPFTLWVWIYHQINEDGTQYGCLGSYRADNTVGWNQDKLDPGTDSQEFILGNRQYIPDLVIP